MVWFKIDDGFYDHRKVFDLSDSAVALWTRAGSWSARNLTNGFVPANLPARLCGDPETAIRELVDRALWQRTRGGFQFHDWTDYNPTAEQVKAKRAKDIRRAAMHRDTALLDAVRARDGDSCRYCGTVVNWADRRSGAGGTYDHVDPDGPNTTENLVVACRSCNSRKGQRTPEQAGLTLRASIRIKNGFNPDLERTKNSSAPRPDPTRPEPMKKETLSGSPDAGFEEFYAVYPRRVGKKAAYEKWKKAVREGADPTTITAGAKRYADERRGENPRFTKHPSTWLSQGCWDDDPAPTQGHLGFRNPNDPNDYYGEL
ncbi:HNH endonuclease [Amycolatopsis sp. NPDC021455]|uniref:HNH endonuclease n=1 Tax=Amycolatopsis sp. NPDC021455 TaxID=3154901 RepID=UPI0033EC8059